MISCFLIKNAAPQICFSQGMRGNLNMRPIDFFERSTHIIHQINDGPCALIAVCKWNWLYFRFLYHISSWFGFILFFTTGNILLLKGDIFFERDETVVSMDYLLNLVFTLIRESAKMQVLLNLNFEFEFLVSNPGPFCVCIYVCICQ
jgi:alanyl-tRNA synthetase